MTVVQNFPHCQCENALYVRQAVFLVPGFFEHVDAAIQSGVNNIVVLRLHCFCILSGGNIELVFRESFARFEHGQIHVRAAGGTDGSERTLATTYGTGGVLGIAHAGGEPSSFVSVVVAP